MAEPEPGHEERTRPRLPLWIAILSIVLALVSASILVYVLYKETKGPGEVLREFARRVDRHDCEGSYELLDPSAWGDVPVDRWCEEFLPAFDANLDADFKLNHAVLEGDTATVEISSGESDLIDTALKWELRRFGERSWRVVGPPDGLNVLLPWAQT